MIKLSVNNRINKQKTLLFTNLFVPLTLPQALRLYGRHWVVCSSQVLFDNDRIPTPTKGLLGTPAGWRERQAKIDGFIQDFLPFTWYFLQRPSAPRKVGIPLSALTPAPVSATMYLARATNFWNSAKSPLLPVCFVRSILVGRSLCKNENAPRMLCISYIKSENVKPTDVWADWR